MTPTLDQFINELRVVARKHNVNVLAVAGVDPRTGVARVYADPSHIALLKKTVATRFELTMPEDAETEVEWSA